MKTKKSFEIRALVGIDGNGEQVLNYNEAQYFATADDNDVILCWGIYEKHSSCSIQETEIVCHIADFPTEDNAESMLKFLEENV